MDPDAIHPVHDYGIPDELTPQRAARMRADDADAFAPYHRQEGDPWFREWTQHEASHAIGDRHLLMHELARALEELEQLRPRTVERWAEADMLPVGTLVQEANGEISQRTIDRGGRHLWQSPGDEDYYHSAELSYPIKVLHQPPVEDEG